MSGSKDIIPGNWPPEIKNILNILPLEYRTKITDFINLSYQAGFFDGEGTFLFHPNTIVPRIGSQDIECLLLYLRRHGGRIGLMGKAGTPVYASVDGKRIITYKYNRDMYYWDMTGRIRGKTSRSYVDKTKFLLSILPLQHNKSKIRDTVRTLLDLGWSSRARWEHLIPEVIVDLDDIKSSDDMDIRKRLESGMEDVMEWFR